MERLITNLLSNAMKYTPEGGWVDGARKHGDGRCGWLLKIPAWAFRHRTCLIFSTGFYRVPDPNPEKGLGLGLSFVASIVKAHGGEMNVVSQVGKGTRFEISLPRGNARLSDEQLAMEKAPLTKL